MLTRAALLCLLAYPALAQNYLPQASIAAAQTRSASQCTTVKCDGTATKYWWPVISLTDSTAAIVVQPDSDYGPTVTKCIPPNAISPCVNTTGTLTAGEIAALQTRAQMGTKLPDILPSATFVGRFTAPQQTAIAANATVALEWTTLKNATNVDLTDPVMLAWLNSLPSKGLIPASQIDTVLAPTAVAVVPP